MNIQIVNIRQGYESTLSTLLVDKVNGGFVLQDTDRGLTSMMSKQEIASKKVWGRTAIPTGRYRVRMYKSPRFGIWLPHLENVPGFDGILIHKGNYTGDTDGCLMPGKTYDQDKLKYFRVWDSKSVFDPLLAKVQAAENRNEPVWCEVSRLYKV